MKFMSQGLALTLAGAGLISVPATLAQAQPPPGPSLVQQMTSQAQGAVNFSDNPATGRVGFVRTRGGGDLMPTRKAANRSGAVAKADAYVSRFAGSFGARAAELRQHSVVANPHGWTVSFTQQYQGVPVFGSMLRANIDRQGDLTSVNGFAAPGIALNTTVRHTAAAAGARAVSLVKAKPPTGQDGRDGNTVGIEAEAVTKVVYRTGSTRGAAGENLMAYAAEVTNGENIRDMVILDANTLKPVNRWSMITDSLERELYTVDDDSLVGLWNEGDPLPGSLDQNQQNLLDSAAETWAMFDNTFGRDSFDAAGGTMITVHNSPDQCPNASWNGIFTQYCAGVYSDDLVAHEWGHAYTQYTSGLIYQWQSGALNESYADVWGETLDLLNNRQDEGEGDLAAKRPDGLCSTHTRVGVSATIDAPASIAGPCETAYAAAFGPQFSTAGVTGTVVVATDAADADGPSPTDGCSTLENAAALVGKWAYVDRGTCTFATKIQNVIDSGASGIVMGNTDADGLSLTGDYPDLYGVMVSQADGTRIKSAGEPVSLTITEDARPSADSYRWLIGEKATAFGGAVRDMWNPTCYGDPGKVSDVEYQCGSDDGGGVHGNSGVANHAYAMLVDGGTYNGVTSSGIGLDKSANIYYRAMTAYLTPTSDFVDQADALEASCADLIGADINKLTLGAGATAPRAESITSSDCAQVAKVNNAVEFRADPVVKCEWTPLLDPNAPSLCGEGFTDVKIWGEDFEKDGLNQWIAGDEVRYPGGMHSPWVSTSSAPAGHRGTVAYGPTPPQGSCAQEGGDDFSSLDWITSPAAALPATGLKPRLSFDHYVATEGGFDGGNVQVSFNGGQFQTVPTGAYLFNAPGPMEPSEAFGGYSTSPLADGEAFSGSNPGSLTGSWGTSIIDLEKIGVQGPGTIQFRFQVGRDGCGGVDGWYLDNVELIVCEVATTVTAVHKTEPARLGQASVVQARVTNTKTGTGLPPRGSVELRAADGSVLDAGTVSSGMPVSLRVPASAPAGVHRMSVAYLGDGKSAASSAPVTVTVVDPNAQVASTTKVKAKPAKPRHGKPFKLVARVRASQSVSGKVAFTVGGRSVGSAKVKNGKAVLKVSAKKAKRIKVGKRTVKARYRGAKQVRPSTGSTRITVRR